ncbi:hypothetical protein H2248_009901 [Termitomyces sp. 'cryptogamus']|nr:hypothetical protein H2248_009901 [Termitomyces sp. 'cryptogamus']
MSSRPSEHRRRDRSWEREDRDRYSRSSRSGGLRNTHDEGRRRLSRSRSPRRGGDRDRRPSDRRERDGDRRDRDRDWNRDRDRERDRDRRDDRGGKRKDDDRDRRDDRRDPPRKERTEDSSYRPLDEGTRSSQPFKAAMPTNIADATIEPVTSRLNLDPDAPDEEGEAMDAENDDDATMMAAMGLSGFGSTKGKSVEGNQDGAVFLKKQRTWRQYMNRRGGFNRPLDKIK